MERQPVNFVRRLEPLRPLRTAPHSRPHRPVLGRAALCAALVVAALWMPANAQLPPVVTQFDTVGFIERATLDRPGDLFSGGLIRVNNIDIIVPANTVLQMPASALTWQQVFALAPAPYTGIQTGMALADVPKPKYTYEVHVQGNRLPDGRHVAGLMFLSQQSLHSGQGWITAVNFATGEVTVDGTTRVKINDPLGRFSVGFPGGTSPDIRFTIDEDNPTVRASSSYPMCIPRSATDALCPQKNRPINPATGNTFLGFYTMAAAASTPTPAGIPDPYLMAPFEVGDFVTYNGLLIDDANGTYVLAHTMIADATILTAPGSVPAYTAIDVLLMGVVPKTGAPAGTEGNVRTRVEGWSTDAGGATAVDVYAVDVQPCTGAESERLWVDNLATPLTPYTVDIDIKVALGRWRFRPKAKDESFFPPTRNLRARNTSLAAIDHPVILTPNGLKAGEYTAPLFQFGMPEAVPPGSGPPPANPFENFMFLAQGEGPYNGGAVLGQLSPWPSLITPAAPLSCAAAPPPPPPPPPPGTLPPTANPDTLQLTRIGTPLAFTGAQLLANDTPAGTLTFVAVAPFSVGGGTITGTGTFTYTPPAGLTGNDTFTYEIADAFGGRAIGTVTVTPPPVDTTAPVVTLTSPLGGIVSGPVTVAANATDNVGVLGVKFFDGLTQIGPEVLAPPYSAVWNTAAVADGVHTLTAVARDAAGNIGTSPIDGVTVSNPKVVPNVVGLTQAAASTAITAASLTVGTITTGTSTTVPAGSVISETPVAGTSVASGSAVSLVVSSGLPPVAVPNVVGLTQAAATTAITTAGLTVGTITTASSTTVPAGSVISQNPVAGTSVAAGSAVALVVSSGLPPVTVPNVVNLTQAAATTAITGAGLTLGTTTTLASATVPAGNVISQNPAAGASVAPGTAVALVISTGPGNVTVPNVVNQTQTAASTAITGAGLVVGTITTANSATVPIGSVISQTPAPGTSVAAGSAVALTVSLGPATVAVPNVVNLTQTAATTAITGAGLVLGTVTTANSNTVPAGTVISQTPAAGTTVAPGSAVALTVSLGPLPVTVPNVVNLTQTAATTAITGAGLVVGTIIQANSATVPTGSVISQTPAAGASVASGSAVALTVSLGPAVAGPTVDKTAFSEGAGTRTTTAFVTAAANEQIVAFAASDGPPSANGQTLTISGSGLVWTRVQRAATRFGDAEIWTARAATAGTSITVTSTQTATGFQQSLTVVAFTGVSAIGASATGGALTGATSVSLVSQAAGSVVYGVGNDWDAATARTLPATQTMVHQFVDTAVGDTFWVQRATAATTAVGQTVTVNTTAPTADQWNFAIVELRP